MISTVALVHTAFSVCRSQRREQRAYQRRPSKNSDMLMHLPQASAQPSPKHGADSVTGEVELNEEEGNVAGTTRARSWEPLAIRQLPTRPCGRTWASHKPLFASGSRAGKQDVDTLL